MRVSVVWPLRSLVAVGEVDHIIDEIKNHAQRVETGKDMGAIVNEASVERITGYIDAAEAQGAKVLVDGLCSKAVLKAIGLGPPYWTM